MARAGTPVAFVEKLHRAIVDSLAASGSWTMPDGDRGQHADGIRSANHSWAPTMAWRDACRH
jgi:hypothetical protein